MSRDFYVILTWILALSAIALHIFTLQDAININDLKARVTALESTGA